jgi:hypothetical protein
LKKVIGKWIRAWSVQQNHARMPIDQSPKKKLC